VANPSPNKRQTGFEGRVVLNVSGVTGVGKLRVSVNQSSGNGALDDHALNLMNQAVQVAPIPDQLNRREFVIAVPVEYRLGDD
jgi:TonB family protein